VASTRGYAARPHTDRYVRRRKSCSGCAAGGACDSAPAGTDTDDHAQVTAKLASLAKSSEQLAEQLNKPQIDIAAAQKAVSAANQAADVAQVHLAAAQRALAISISSQYKAASFSRTAALLASNSGEGYLQTVQTMNLLTEHQSQVATMAASAIADATAATAVLRPR